MFYAETPEEAPLVLLPTLMIGGNTALRGSNLESNKKATEMLELSASVGLESWIEGMRGSNREDGAERKRIPNCPESRRMNRNNYYLPRPVWPSLVGAST
jgi:hypothetical protein